jgi:heme-degrading monooxygenase HmoA
MVVVIFRTRLRPGVEKEVEEIGRRLYGLASAMPGFISYHEYGAADGESVAIVEFDSPETLAAWREHPEHKAAQELGRQKYFSEYRIQVCSPIREYSYRAEGQPAK